MQERGGKVVGLSASMCLTATRQVENLRKVLTCIYILSPVLLRCHFEDERDLMTRSNRQQG